MDKIEYPKMRVEVKIALLTGASRGLGKWVSLGLAHAGATNDQKYGYLRGVQIKCHAKNNYAFHGFWTSGLLINSSAIKHKERGDQITNTSSINDFALIIKRTGDAVQ